MFGLGKVFSGFFESIGMGWMGSVISLATNFMMGNWVGVAEDIFRLVSEFSNDSWRETVDRNQPLGSFDRSSCFGDGCSLSQFRITDLMDRADRDDVELSWRARGTLNEAGTTVQLRAEVDNNRRQAFATTIA